MSDFVNEEHDEQGEETERVNIRLGRPYVPINKEVLQKLIALQCTIVEIAGWFGCSIDAIRDFCQREYGQSWGEVRNIYKAYGTISLRRAQFQKALAGDTKLLIHLGQQLLGQTKGDKEVEEPSSPFDFNSSDKEEVLNIIKNQLEAKKVNDEST